MSIVVAGRLMVFAFALLSACSGGGSAGTSSTQTGSPAAAAQATVAPQRRAGFLGAFFRAAGPPPYGPFSVYSKQLAPLPYPTPGSTLFGSAGYCDAIAGNGVSISTGYTVDPDKISHIVDLGVKWTRTNPSPFNDDASHVYGPTSYRFADLDSAECMLARHNITPLIAMEAGPVQYNAVPGQFSPRQLATYQTPADYGTWCGVVAKHETQIFTNVYRYSLPGNEVNSNTQLFPGGEPQIAAYAQACYGAIKAVQPKAFVYGFELNMDARRDPIGFVQRLYALGCKVGTCYDGLSIHLSLKYPIPPDGTPCFTNPGGTYTMQCIADIQAAAQAPIHVIIGETVYVIPGSVPDEATKATAIVAAMKAFASSPAVDGVNYANVDECDMYPTGYFVGGCIIDSLGNKLPGYTALQALAAQMF